jgi:hypothetical protein
VTVDTEVIDFCLKKKNRNGLTTRFWLDGWLLDTSLSYAFPHLFSLVLHTNVMVAQAFQLGISNMQFIQSLQFKT